MPYEFATTRRVEFAETDMAGIAHYSNFFRWMESTEHAFFRSLGLTVHGELDGLAYGFARAHASCDYERPVRYQDLLEVRLTVRGKTPKAFTYDFDFRLLEEAAGAPERESPEGGTSIAHGRLEVVCVSKPRGGSRMRAIDVPAQIARLVDAAPGTP